MSVRRDLERIHDILMQLAEAPECVKISHYDPDAIRIIARGLERAIRHYKSESLRTIKYHRKRY